MSRPHNWMRVASLTTTSAIYPPVRSFASSCKAGRSAQRLEVALRDHPVEGVHVTLAGRVPAGREAAGADALLRERADVPVLAVDLIPELHRVGGVEPVGGDRLGLEEPLAHDLRAIRGL